MIVLIIEWVCSLEEDGLIDEDQLDELLMHRFLPQPHAEQDWAHIRWICRYHQVHT